jgi:hypothetical protein
VQAVHAQIASATLLQDFIFYLCCKEPLISSTGLDIYRCAQGHACDTDIEMWVLLGLPDKDLAKQRNLTVT